MIVNNDLLASGGGYDIFYSRVNRIDESQAQIHENLHQQYISALSY